MGIVTKLIWSKDQKRVIGSVRIDEKEYDEDLDCIISFEHDNTVDFVVAPTFNVAKAVANHMAKIVQKQNEK